MSVESVFAIEWVANGTVTCIAHDGLALRVDLPSCTTSRTPKAVTSRTPKSHVGAVFQVLLRSKTTGVQWWVL